MLEGERCKALPGCLKNRKSNIFMDVVIVCHTEFGSVAVDKTVVFEKKGTKGVSQGVANLNNVAGKYGAKITYAVCPEVADFFPETSHEIGLHVHPGWEEFKKNGLTWTVGDSWLRQNGKFGKTSTALADYTFEEQLEMIGKGQDLLEKKFGRPIKVFLAGRWSVNTGTMKALAQLGFTHDCSAYPGLKLPYFDWSKLPRICMPYHPAENDYQARGGLPLLMVPVSRMMLTGAVCPEDEKKCGIAWLKACFSEYYKQNAPLFHIALHSPVMTDSYYISVLDDLLSFISLHENIHFKFVSQIEKYPHKNYKPGVLPYVSSINGNLIKTLAKRVFTV